MEKNNISNQICVYKTGKALIEFNDKLNLAPLENYGHIHASGEKIDNYKQYSLINIVMNDYSKGTGDNTVRVTANISPQQAKYIYSKIFVPVKEFSFYKEKIFGNADKEGYSQMTKLTIKRAQKASDGKDSRYPWQVWVENGKGKAVKVETGGISAEKGSYKAISKVGIYINDEDFFNLFSKIDSFINVWEISNASRFIKSGRDLYDKTMLEIKSQKDNKNKAS